MAMMWHGMVEEGKRETKSFSYRRCLMQLIAWHAWIAPCFFPIAIHPIPSHARSAINATPCLAATIFHLLLVLSYCITHLLRKRPQSQLSRISCPQAEAQESNLRRRVIMKCVVTRDSHFRCSGDISASKKNVLSTSTNPFR